jgi:heme-degrading monooxygenase HmoA
MAVVVVAEIEGGTQEFYEQVSEKAMGGDQLPAGGRIHVAGPVKNGWRVITVWDSEEQFDRFRNERLIPALQEAGEEGRVAPQISVDPVHKLITA